MGLKLPGAQARAGSSPAARTIAAECPARGWYLCAWAGRLPTDSDVFLWEPDSPVNRDASGQPRFLGGVLLALVASQPASAQSLEEALANAYATNPTIDSQRAQLRATDELVPQALSGYRPSVEANADAGYSRQRLRAAGTTRDSNLQQRGVDLSVVQPLYTGGRTAASTKRAEALVQAQRADLLSTEQTVLLDAATA